MNNNYQEKINTAQRQSDTNLIRSLKAGVLEEKKLLADCLILLSEIMKRNIHTKSGYSSLHKYCRLYFRSVKERYTAELK